MDFWTIFWNVVLVIVMLWSLAGIVGTLLCLDRLKHARDRSVTLTTEVVFITLLMGLLAGPLWLWGIFFDGRTTMTPDSLVRTYAKLTAISRP